MTDATPQERTALEAYIAPAAESAGGWVRLAIGVLILIAGNVVASVLVLIPYGAFVFVREGHKGHELGADELKQALLSGGPASVFALLGSLALMWPVIIGVCRLVHKQRFTTLFSPDGRIRWRDFRTGALLAIGLALAGIAAASLVAGPPVRTSLDAFDWAALFVPLAVLVFLQTGAEELVFRGYLLQRLALISRRPIVWALLPSLGFAAIHYSPDLPGGILGVAAIFLFALVCCALVFQTGALWAAMGFHAGYNLVGLGVAGSRDYLSGTQLFSFDAAHATTAAIIDIGLLAAALAFVLWSDRARRP